MLAFGSGSARAQDAQSPSDPIGSLSLPPRPDTYKGNDDKSHPLGARQRAARIEGLQEVLTGRGGAGRVHRLRRGLFVELAREDEDSIWTVIGEFGNQINPTTGGTPGPLHNQIPQPNRAVDNTTIWAPDFSKSYYENLMFNDSRGAISMRNFYKEISSNRYAVNGEVTDWVQVPYNEARYGTDLCGSNVCSTVWAFVQDSVNAWYNAQIAAGQTPAQINDYLSRFDKWDRYDYDGDGNFDEPDGYIDHFQSVHAGDGQETGGGAQGSDAIWSHRWYAFYNLIGSAGPAFNRYGGVRIGNSNYWIGDYTIEPENGGVGVFSHEFGHDLGLPDLYDTSGGDNSVGFWSIMASGSYGNDGTVDLGSTPVHMGAWEKLQLGWLKYDTAKAGKKSLHILGPAEGTTLAAQALVVNLPDKKVTTTIGPPYAGANFYYSGSGNDLDNFMTQPLTLAAGAQLTARVRYEIEENWDYAYVVVSTDGGATWTPVATNLSTNSNPNGQNFGNGITGSSDGNWVALTANLSAFTGNVLVGFRYWTDGAAAELGLSIDDVQIGAAPLDGAEGMQPWTFAPATGGFRVTTGTEVKSYFNSYIGEYRQYLASFDSSLKTGPYIFGYSDPALFNYVDHFPYQDGLLITYWDDSQTDNDTSVHPGAGLILPIDSHPEPMLRPSGTVFAARYQSYDSTFTIQPTNPFKVHVTGIPVNYPSQKGVPVFKDTLQYWRAATPLAGVKNPNTGTSIEIKGLTPFTFFMLVEVKPVK